MVCHIDCSAISDAKQLHQCLARFLNFPDWYGHNLDALYDCLTELPSPTQLSFSGFEAVLEDAQLDCPELTVRFE